ncbi:DUF4210 domain protein, FAM214A-like protein, implicated in chromosome segregation [Schizosaccharomyces osmophilus]|uniref:DUF4210 domain protein, FAM214A-like protein, implicated in chromosome segregation n=1 Tax=Schizosaccharomyces osmophilus TaxID=2545709 RepID=A0AAE9W7T0_9SCHI|nr:DUF4210 domain protein, FAM214A-like protein, implicated in chromosome segregation [Schizosaccharomyces osmophilus]WBW71437.1 DUF4210 domain protein, FAM214A-like protein, implicated in chromosome segregation [Schizosaccharomyces osmophilus]
MPACYSLDFLPLPSKSEKSEYCWPLKRKSSRSQSAQVDFLNNVFYDLKKVKAKGAHPHLPVCSSPLRNQVPYFDDPDLIDDNQNSLTFEDQYRFWLSLSKNSVHSNCFGSLSNFQLQSKRNELWGRFVGSYEESLFNCKMPLNPSQCIPFVVDIGVVSQCKCRSSLICPPHFKMRFWSAYYTTDDSDFQSPYVGQFYVPESTAQKNRKRKTTVCGYQIPQVGQLQVMIKRLDGTLIKIYLIQYDLSDMPNESKASIRQVIYLDLFRDTPERSFKYLKYGVHLQIRSLNNQYFLYGIQRVIFSSWSFQNSNNTLVVNKQSYFK